MPKKTKAADEKQSTYEEQFRERVERVLAVMSEERIDWRGQALITSDGRIVTRVLPVEKQA